MEVQRSRTLVVVPPSREDELLDLAQQWTASWLIKSALWLRASDLIIDQSDHPNAPPRVAARVIARNGSATVDLFDELGRDPCDLVRVVAIRALEPGEAVNEELDFMLDKLRSNLYDYSKPDTTRIIFLNLVFSPTHLTGGSAEHLIELGWNMNILVSSEDRPTPTSFDAFTRHTDAERWLGFVLGHAATAAGLWSTMTEAPYDDASVESAQDHVHLQRVNIRGVLTGSLVVNIALSAMQMAIQDKTPLMDPLMTDENARVRIMTPEEEDLAIRDLIRITLQLEDGQLSYRPPSTPEPPTRLRVGFVAQARALGRFALDKIVDSPRWILRKLKARLSRKSTSHLHGEEGDVEVDVAGILHWEDAAFADEVSALNKRKKALIDRLNESIPAQRFDVHSRLWLGLRQSSFALLDGSAFPDGISLDHRIAQGDQTPIVSSISSLYPDWAEVWSAPSDVAAELTDSYGLPSESISWLDISYTRKWRRELDRRVQRLDDRDGELRKHLGGHIQELSRVEEELLNAQVDADVARQEWQWAVEDLEAYRQDKSDGAARADVAIRAEADTSTPTETPLLSAPLDKEAEHEYQ